MTLSDQEMKQFAKMPKEAIEALLKTKTTLLGRVRHLLIVDRVS